VSGQEALKALQKKGFGIRMGRGDHVVVKKEDVQFVVPLHPQLKKGTLDHIIKSSGDFKEGFHKYL
jgi:predicted RNA binding protein YcfA (HicA-like mRNA interferase family)